MKNRKRLDRVQGDQDSNQELLVLSLQGQRKAIDDALEWRGGEQGSCNQAPVPPTRPPPNSQGSANQAPVLPTGGGMGGTPTPAKAITFLRSPAVRPHH